MIASAKNKSMLLGGVAFLALSASANAQSIDTTPQWDGIRFIGDWGVTNTATYGQTITPTVAQTRLSSFTFQLSQIAGAAPQYQAFVYQWDATNQRIIGSACSAPASLLLRRAQHLRQSRSIPATWC